MTVRGTHSGAFTLLVAFIAICPLAALANPQGSCQSKSLEGSSEGAPPFLKEDDEAEEVALLQVSLHVDARAPVAASAGQGRLDGHRVGWRCPSLARAAAVLAWMSSPPALVMVLSSWALIARYELARARSAQKLLLAHKPETAKEERSQAPADVEVPTVILIFVALGVLMISVNFTIVLPSSERVMVEAGGTTFLSGVAIGAYALGCLAGLPLMLYFSRSSYRAGMAFTAIVAVLGNIVYALAASARGGLAILGMILARVLCGLEGGSIIVFANASLALSSGVGTARGAAALSGGTGLGLALGPALSSLSQLLFPHARPEVPPSIVMVLLAGAYGAASAACVPARAECFRLAGLPDSEHAAAEDDEGSQAYPEVQLRASWLNLGLTCVLSFARLFQRVAWEMGALLVLTRCYGFSDREAGFWIAAPVLGSMPFLFAARHFARLGTLGLMRLLGCVELLGIVLMVPVGLPHAASLTVFLVGSWLFYVANWMSLIPWTMTLARFALKGHGILNLEMATTLRWATGFVGYLYGPILSRAVMGICPSQGMLVACSLVFFVASTLALEVGAHFLLASDS